MNAAVQEKPSPKMMVGSGGKLDYLVVARQGDVALGVKPNAVLPGKFFGQPGTVWFGARLRSAPSAHLFKDEQQGNVVKLEKKPENHWDCWPNIVWEKQDATRASTEIGVLLRGSLDGTKEEAQQLFKELKGGKLAKKMADYLYEIAGEQNMILSRKEITDWLTENVYAKIAKEIEDTIKRKELFKEEMGKNIGVFGMQAQILKKVYDTVKAKGEEADDEEEEFDEDIDADEDDQE